MPRPKRYARSARPARSVATRAKKRTSATAQSKQIQTLARQVVSLKKHQALSKTSIMTIGRCDAINLARSFATQTGTALAQDKAWCMPIAYAPATALGGIALPQNTTIANNSPLRDANQNILEANTMNKQSLFGGNFNASNVQGITHKGGTLRMRVVCTFKQPTSLHFFLVRPAKKSIADNLMKDIGYLEQSPVQVSPFPLRGAGVALREEIDYTLGSTAGTTGGVIDAKYRNMIPNCAFMNLKNWEVISKRTCNFDFQAQTTLATLPPNINSSADPDNNMVYKNLSFKIPSAGRILRNDTSKDENLGTTENYGIVEQQNEKNVFLVCLRTLRNGGPAPSSNPGEYCTATLTQLDKYAVYT